MATFGTLFLTRITAWVAHPSAAAAGLTAVAEGTVVLVAAGFAFAAVRRG
ncbi:hypothetical protein [Rhodococcus spelaei]|nr:hypothetical protein [Rhodococcus spelaei]